MLCRAVSQLFYTMMVTMHGCMETNSYFPPWIAAASKSAVLCGPAKCQFWGPAGIFVGHWPEGLLYFNTCYRLHPTWPTTCMLNPRTVLVSDECKNDVTTTGVVFQLAHYKVEMFRTSVVYSHLNPGQRACLHHNNTHSETISQQLICFWLLQYNTSRDEYMYDLSTEQDRWHANWKRDEVTDSVFFCSTLWTHVSGSHQMARPTGSVGYTTLNQTNHLATGGESLNESHQFVSTKWVWKLHNSPQLVNSHLIST